MMTTREFMQRHLVKKGVLGAMVTGVVAPLFVCHVEPFKSHLLLALLMAGVVGVLIASIEGGIRKLARRNRSSATVNE